MWPQIKYQTNRSWQQLRFRLSADLPGLLSVYYTYFYKPVPRTLPAFLDIYSKGKKPFVVIQVGANDGLIHDLIHKFIKRDRWQGVLLEPQPDVYRRLQRLHRHSRGIQTCQAALGETDGRLPLYTIGFSRARWATGLASFNRQVLEQAFAEGYVARKAAAEGVQIPGDTDLQIKAIPIQVWSVASVKRMLPETPLDLLQIDTEGFDARVVELFAEAGCLPPAVIYENAHLSEMERRTCRNLLEQQGFACFDYGKDTLAVRDAALDLHQHILLP